MIDVPERVSEALRDGRLKKRYRIAVDGKFDVDIDDVSLQYDPYYSDEKRITIEVSGTYRIAVNNAPYNKGTDINPDTGQIIEYTEGALVYRNNNLLEPTIKEEVGNDLYNLTWEYYFNEGDTLIVEYYSYMPPQ